LPWGLLKG